MINKVLIIKFFFVSKVCLNFLTLILEENPEVIDDDQSYNQDESSEREGKRLKKMKKHKKDKKEKKEKKHKSSERKEKKK